MELVFNKRNILLIKELRLSFLPQEIFVNILFGNSLDKIMWIKTFLKLTLNGTIIS